MTVTTISLMLERTRHIKGRHAEEKNICCYFRGGNTEIRVSKEITRIGVLEGLGRIQVSMGII